MKRIAILGSTGSIGRNTLEVIKHHPDKFKVVALSANSNIGLLRKQIDEFKPALIGFSDAAAAGRLKDPKVKLFSGSLGLQELVRDKRIDEVVVAVSGSSALLPLLSALDCGKQIALANKEALVMAGSIIMRLSAKKKAKIIPVDSEQSAIWQCLDNQRDIEVKNIYLTASGGPFKDISIKKLENISVAAVLKHPRWSMGKKISVDSASLMNKGLEFLEAMFLFGAPPEKIKVLIHPESIVHSMVEFQDGVVIAQLSATDMRIPIQYALTYPQRLTNSLPSIDFYKLKQLHFAKPDENKFPCLGLAYRAARELGTVPAVLNAANEASVECFLKEKISFLSIPKVIEKVLDKHQKKDNPGLNDILEADSWARQEAYEVIRGEN